MKPIKRINNLFGFVVIVLLSTSTFGQSSTEQLSQFVQQLQTTPNDSALREKIIKFAQDMKSPPSVPDDAKDHLARGNAAFKIATSAEDFEIAAAEFQKASNSAPWWPNAYFNLGTSLQKAGKFSQAAANFKLYLNAAPNAADAEQVRTSMYEAQMLSEKATKASAEAAETEAVLQKGQAVALEVVRLLRNQYGGPVGRYSYCFASTNRCYEAAEQLEAFSYSLIGSDQTKVKLTSPGGGLGRGEFCGAPKAPALSQIDWSFCDRKIADEITVSITFATSDSHRPWVEIAKCPPAGGPCFRERAELRN